MRNNLLLGIAGKARSGKDTVAQFVVSLLGGYTYAFADPIRQMLSVLGINLADPYWEARKEDIIPALGVSPRQLMQTLGSDWGRQLNPDLWVIRAKQRLLDGGPGMIISDVRHENEAQWIRSLGGRILHVERQAILVNPHTSEEGIEVKPEDLQIFNNGTLEDLQHAVREIFDVHKT